MPFRISRCVVSAAERSWLFCCVCIRAKFEAKSSPTYAFALRGTATLEIGRVVSTGTLEDSEVTLRANAVAKSSATAAGRGILAAVGRGILSFSCSAVTFRAKAVAKSSQPTIGLAIGRVLVGVLFCSEIFRA